MLLTAFLVAWIFGILISGYLAPNILVFILPLFFIGAVTLLHGLKLACKKEPTALKTFFCILFGFLLIFILGNRYYHQYTARLFDKAEGFAAEHHAVLEGTIISEVQTYDDTSYFYLKEETGLKISVKIRTDLPLLCGQQVSLQNPELSVVIPANQKIQATRKLLGQNALLYANFPYDANVTVTNVGNGLLYYGKQLRLATANRLNELYPSHISTFLTALLCSDRSQMPEELYDRFLDTGTVHIVVVSGMHFQYLMVTVLFLLSFFAPSRRKRLIYAFFVLLLFVFYTGTTLPVLRSFMMMCAAFLSDLFYQKQQKKHQIVLLTAGAFLTVTPTLIFNPSFLLTFGASVGITVFCKPVEQKLKWIPSKFLRSYLATYLSVQLMTLPVVLFFFGRMPLVSILINFLVAPLVAPILIVCLVVLAISKIPLISAPFTLVCHMLSALFLWLVEKAADIPLIVQFSLTDAAFIWLLISMAMLACVPQIPKKAGKRLLLLLVVGCLTVASYTQAKVPYSPRMLITFFGAKNTNSAAVFTPHDQLILYGSATDIIHGQASGAYRENAPIELLILTDSPQSETFSQFLETHPVNQLILLQKQKGELIHPHDDIQYLDHPITILADGVRICINTDGKTLYEAEFSYQDQPVSFTQNAAYLLEHMERNPKKNWVFNFRQSSNTTKLLPEKSIPTKLFSKKQWHPDAILYNNYSMIQADAGGVRLIHSAE